MKRLFLVVVAVAVLAVSACGGDTEPQPPATQPSQLEVIEPATTAEAAPSLDLIAIEGYWCPTLFQARTLWSMEVPTAAAFIAQNFDLDTGFVPDAGFTAVSMAEAIEQLRAITCEVGYARDIADRLEAMSE